MASALPPFPSFQTGFVKNLSVQDGSRRFVPLAVDAVAKRDKSAVLCVPAWFRQGPTRLEGAPPNLTAVVYVLPPQIASRGDRPFIF